MKKTLYILCLTCILTSCASHRLTNTEKYGTVIRAKGIVPAADGRWIHFDYVPDEYEVRYGSADVTGRIVVIGTELNKDELTKTFKKQ